MSSIAVSTKMPLGAALAPRPVRSIRPPAGACDRAEAAEAPAFLIPAAPDDPARGGIGGGILGDALQRLFE